MVLAAQAPAADQFPEPAGGPEFEELLQGLSDGEVACPAELDIDELLREFDRPAEEAAPEPVARGVQIFSDAALGRPNPSVPFWAPLAECRHLRGMFYHNSASGLSYCVHHFYPFVTPRYEFVARHTVEHSTISNDLVPVCVACGAGLLEV